MALRIGVCEDSRLLETSEGRISLEQYRIEVRKGTDDGCDVELLGASESAVSYGLHLLARLIERDELREGIAIDYPAFAVRGIIEGYYGPPWSESARFEMIDFISRFNMNAYVYGPKDDPFHRERWREPYDESALGRLSNLVARCRRRNVALWYGIGPGLSMRYTSEADRTALFEKLNSLRSIGISHFGLFLDDIPAELQHAEDRSTYPDLAHAHAAVANRLFDELRSEDPHVRLAVCPTEYHGHGDEYYISTLGRLIHPLVDLFWTGPEICSRELTAHDAMIFSSATNHLPLYWDNYPVNDLEMRDELHIGPYRGRDPQLGRASAGIIANAMEYPEASKIAIATIAAYLWNPEAYDPERAFDAAIEAVVGPEDAASFRMFADTVRFSPIWRTDAPILAHALERFRFEFEVLKSPSAGANLRQAIAPLVAAADALAEGLRNRTLMKEIQRWVSKFRTGIGLLSRALVVLESEDEGLRETLREEYGAYMKDATRVFADVLYPFLADLLQDGRNAEQD